MKRPGGIVMNYINTLRIYNDKMLQFKIRYVDTIPRKYKNTGSISYGSFLVDGEQGMRLGRDCRGR